MLHRWMGPMQDGRHSDTVMADLIRSTWRNINLVLGGSLLLWFIVATATWPDLYGWQARGFVFLLIAICGLALWLLARRSRLTNLVWQVGMLAAVTLGAWLFQSRDLALFFILLPFVAVITSGWHAGLWVQGAILALLTWLAHGATPTLAFGTYYAVIALGGVAAGLVGVVLTRTLFTAMEWFVLELARSDANLESARLHRSQLMRTQKSLDEAYYQLKRANAALVAAWKAADAAERFKSEFVANVSHELRTPLNLIVGYSEVMMTSPESYGGVRLPGAYRSDMNAVYHSAQHLLALVDDVLDLARLDVGKLVMSRDDVEVAALVMEALEIVRDYIVTKGLELQIELAPDLPRLRVDRLRMRQVLLNLLVNAARFTDQGTIRIAAQLENGQVMFRVSDSGRGIPDHDLPRIFQEFRATEQPFSTWHSGTGLGLPISKKFVELNGGTMGVTSVFGQGASFWFTLPIHLPDALPSPAGARPHHPGPLARLSTTDRIVVVVHEDPAIVPHLARHLNEHKIMRAANLAEGIVLAERTKALAILSSTPLQEHPLQGDAIFIHMDQGERCIEGPAGAAHVLVKPVSRQDLEAALQRVGRPVQRILIADDDPELVQLFRRMLDPGDGTRTFFEAYTGSEALHLMRTLQPDLVLLDLVMPDGDGFSVLAQMAAEPSLAAIAVIVASAKGADLIEEPRVARLEIRRGDGLKLPECAAVLDATFKTLAPGWYGADG